MRAPSRLVVSAPVTPRTRTSSRAYRGALAIGVVSLLGACGSQKPAIPHPKLVRMNEVCRRDDATIRSAELNAPSGFTVAAIQAIRAEVTDLRRLGVEGHLHQSLDGVNQATAAVLAGSSDPASVNRRLVAAQVAARTFGLDCSFGAREGAVLP